MLERGGCRGFPGATPELTPEDERGVCREGLGEEGPSEWHSGDTRKWGQAERRPGGQCTEEGSKWTGCANCTVTVVGRETGLVSFGPR